MLVLTRKPRQQIMIGDDIVINVVEVQGENVRLAIDAPREIKIYRGEISRAIQEPEGSCPGASEPGFQLGDVSARVLKVFSARRPSKRR